MDSLVTLGRDYTKVLAKFIPHDGCVDIIKSFYPTELQTQVQTLNLFFHSCYDESSPLIGQQLEGMLHMDHLCCVFRLHHLLDQRQLTVSVRYYSTKYETYDIDTYEPTDGLFDIWGECPQVSVAVKLCMSDTWAILEKDLAAVLQKLRESCMFCGREAIKKTHKCIRCMARYNTKGCAICEDTCGQLLGRDECLGKAPRCPDCRYHACCWLTEFHNTPNITVRSRQCEICHKSFPKRQKQSR